MTFPEIAKRKIKIDSKQVRPASFPPNIASDQACAFSTASSMIHLKGEFDHVFFFQTKCVEDSGKWERADFTGLGHQVITDWF